MTTTRAKQVEYYDDEAGEVRWRVRNENNRITGKSEEGFKNLRGAMDNYQESLRGAAQVVNNSKQGKGRKHDRIEAGQLADNAGSVGGEAEETDTNSGEAGTGGSEVGERGEDAEDPDAGDSGAEGEGSAEG